jgi:hypothetical protein
MGEVANCSSCRQNDVVPLQLSLAEPLVLLAADERTVAKSESCLRDVARV